MMNPNNAESEGQDSGSTLLPDPKPAKQKAPRRALHRWNNLIFDTWFSEFLATVFSVLCFVAIVSILWRYSEQAVPSLPKGVSLNAIISVLSTASKCLLIFAISQAIGQWKWVWFHKRKGKLQQLQSIDDASRGPWGSIVVLGQHKGRSILSLGAAVTVLTLAFDPFLQQILSYPVRQTLSPADQALAKQARVVLPQWNDTNYQQAGDGGIWLTDAELTPACPSGNCTWPVFTSVGYCSKCEDVTSVATLVNCTGIPEEINVTEVRSTDIPCHVKLPYGEESDVPIKLTYTGQGRSRILNMPRDIIWQVGAFGKVLRVGNDTAGSPDRNEAMAFAHAELGSGKNIGDTVSQLGDDFGIKKVTKCVISYCARDYNISVSKGVPIYNISKPDWGNLFYHEIERLKTDGSSKEEQYMCWKPGSDSAVNLTDASSRLGIKQFANTSEFAFCPDPNILWNFMSSFSGSTVWNWESAPNRTDWRLTGSFFNSPSANFKKLDSSSLEEVTRNVAASLTKYLLESSNETVRGSVFTPQVYVAVDWRWIILPALVVVLGIGFVGVTVWVNSCEKLSLWKSSILPVLYHGIDEELLVDEPELETVGKMNAVAEGMEVRLQLSDLKGRLMLR